MVEYLLSSSDEPSLKATVLSCYDLPHERQPASVVLEILGASVETGPPVARHRERNSFKFFGVEEGKPSNELIVTSEKLSSLFSSTATFRVKFDEHGQEDMIAKFQISRRLHVNETKWLILNLRPSEGESSESKTTDDATAPTISSSSITPTLRVKLLLSGPYRPEISSLLSVTKSYFNTVDRCESSLQPLTKTVFSLPSRLPQVPISVAVVVALPILLGLFVVGRPFFLPVLVFLMLGAGAIATSGGVLYFSTKGGREEISALTQPFLTTFLSTETGRRAVFDIGPRPSPQNLAKFILPQGMFEKLITSLVLDFIGSTSYLLPVAGEAFDSGWAPIYAILLGAMFDDVMPSLKYIGFMEEILPFTDVIHSLGYGRLDKGIRSQIA